MNKLYVRPLSLLLLLAVACIGGRDPARSKVVRALTEYLGDIADPRVGYLRDSTHLKVDVATVAFPTWSEERVTEHARGIARVAYRAYPKANELDSVTVAYLEELRPGMSWIRHQRTFPVASLPISSAQPVHEGYVNTSDGVRLFYRTIGTGPDTIVVLHGGPGFTMDYLLPDLEPLAARHVLISYDQRGAGRSTLVSDSASLDAQKFGDDLEAVRAHFKMDRMTLFAHSWGAAVAGVYASQHPQRIARLVIVDGISVRRMYHARGLQTFDSRRDSATRQTLQALSVARLANPGDATACRAYYALFFRATFVNESALKSSRGDFCVGSPEALTNKVKSIDKFTIRSLGDWDWRPAMHAVTAPTLVIRGAFDHVPVESSREWAEAAQNGTFVELEESGHYPYLEVPARFFDVVEKFLAATR